MKFYNQLTGAEIITSPWQDALRVGDYYVNERPTLWPIGDQDPTLPPVYGRLLSDEACEPGYFLVEAFSQHCPEGEVGLFCICEATRQLTEAEFLAAKINGWPK